VSNNNLSAHVYKKEIYSSRGPSKRLFILPKCNFKATVVLLLRPVIYHTPNSYDRENLKSRTTKFISCGMLDFVTGILAW